MVTVVLMIFLNIQTQNVRRFVLPMLQLSIKINIVMTETTMIRMAALSVKYQIVGFAIRFLIIFDSINAFNKSTLQ